MKAIIQGIYNGVNENSFTNEKGDNIKFRTVTLLEEDSSYTLDCTLDKNVNIDMLKRFDSVEFICNIFNGKRPKIIGFKVDTVNAGKDCD